MENNFNDISHEKKIKIEMLVEQNKRVKEIKKSLEEEFEAKAIKEFILNNLNKKWDEDAQKWITFNEENSNKNDVNTVQKTNDNYVENDIEKNNFNSKQESANDSQQKNSENNFNEFDKNNVQNNTDELYAQIKIEELENNNILEHTKINNNFNSKNDKQITDNSGKNSTINFNDTNIKENFSFENFTNINKSDEKNSTKKSYDKEFSPKSFSDFEIEVKKQIDIISNNISTISKAVYNIEKNVNQINKILNSGIEKRKVLHSNEVLKMIGGKKERISGTVNSFIKNEALKHRSINNDSEEKISDLLTYALTLVLLADSDDN